MFHHISLFWPIISPFELFVSEGTIDNFTDHMACLQSNAIFEQQKSVVCYVNRNTQVGSAVRKKCQYVLVHLEKSDLKFQIDVNTI